MKKLYLSLTLLVVIQIMSSAQVVINEIMYNPPEPGTDTLEYLELLNTGNASVDLEGYSFGAGVVYTFSSYSLPPGGYVVVCKDATRMMEVLGVSALEWTAGSLDNAGESIVLLDDLGFTVDSVSYSDQAPWPGLPTDGNGSSLVLCDPVGDHNDPSNWQAAATATGIFVNAIEIKANPMAASGCTQAADKALILTGVFDAQPSNAGAKGVELYTLENIPDLSIYGIGSANNGGGSDGVELTFPAVSATAGQFIYVAADSALFRDYFGFDADYISSAVNINGDDAMEVFENTIVIDVFGDINQDGTGQDWEYLDGWVYRVNGTGPDGNIFEPDHWIYSGIAALEGAPTNELAPTPFPIGSYNPMGQVVLLANDDQVSVPQNMSIEIEVQKNDFKPNPILTFEILSGPDHGNATITNGDAITYDPETDYCGPDNLTYRLCDVDGCDTASVFIEVICPKVYPVYPIGLVTTVNASGVLDSLQIECQLEGVVYGINLRPGGLQFVMIDDQNDGIVVFSPLSFGYTVQEGDRIIVQGRIIQYNGLAEILPDTVWSIASGQMLFPPTETTQLDESSESQLLRILNVHIVDPSEWSNTSPGFNVRITNGNDTMTMRIDDEVDLFGTAAPTGTFHVTGLGTQFDQSSPYFDEYQILPRYAMDIDLVNSILTPEEAVWAIWPNPTSGMIRLESEVPLEFIHILDAHGRSMDLNQSNGAERIWQVDLSDMTQGFYWIQGTTSDGQTITAPVQVVR